MIANAASTASRLGVVVWLLAAARAAAAPAGDPAVEAFLAAEAFAVQPMPGPLPVEPEAALWDRLAAHDLPVTRPLRAGSDEPEADPSVGSRRVRVRAAASDQQLAVVIEWVDSTPDPAPHPGADRGASDERIGSHDAVALEFPERFGAGLRLPHPALGDPGMPVLLYTQRAGAPRPDGGGATPRATVVTGAWPGAPADAGGVTATLRRDEPSRGYRAVFVRPLDAAGSARRRGLVPFSVVLWDGGGGRRVLSGWRFLRLPGVALDRVFASEQAEGYRPGDLGDPARGQLLVEAVCVACHHLPGRALVPAGVAPPLHQVGVWASAAYLRQSLLAPSAVLAHDESGEPPAGWYLPGEAGARGSPRLSKMPPFVGFSSDDVAAVVAYLRTLGRSAPPRRPAGSKLEPR